MLKLEYSKLITVLSKLNCRNGRKMSEHKSENRHQSEHGNTPEHSHSHADAAHPHSHADTANSHSHEGVTHSHSHAHKHTKSVLNRLSRAIGHLTAVRGMVEEGRDCAEVLIQLSAVRSALNGACEVILKDHLDHCIVDAVQTGDTEALDKLNRAIELLLK